MLLNDAETGTSANVKKATVFLFLGVLAVVFVTACVQTNERTVSVCVIITHLFFS